MKNDRTHKIIATLMIVGVISLLSTECFATAQNVEAPSFKWEHEYPGPGQVGDSVSSLIQTSDGGYAFGGTSDPYSGWGALPSTLITKTDSAGVLEWQNQYFYSRYQSNGPKCLGLIQTNDQGYIFAEPDNATFGFVLSKLDSSGANQWNRTLAYSGCSTMILSRDGGYAFAGTSNSKVWLLKTDSVGNVQWNNTYEAKFDRGVTRLIQTQNGSYLMLGSSIIEPNFEGSPATLVMLKTDSAGTLLWQKTYDSNMSSWGGQSIIQTSDNNYVIVDNTNTSVAVFKTDQNGSILWTKNYQSIGTINSIVETSDGGLTLAGTDGKFIRMAKADSLGNLKWSITAGNLNPGPYAKFGVGVLFYDSVNCIVESSDGSLVLAGISDSQNAYQAGYYMTKTQPFLPTPNPTPSLPFVPSALPSFIPTPSPSSIQASPIVSALPFLLVFTAVLAIIAVSVLFFRRHRKSSSKSVKKL